jgi:hypothetical protein
LKYTISTTFFFFFGGVLFLSSFSLFPPSMTRPPKRSTEPTAIEDCVSSNCLAHNTAYHDFDPTTILQIQADLLTWFDAKQRTNMPWRKPARSDLDPEASYLLETERRKLTYSPFVIGFGTTCV